MSSHETYMRRALELAARGAGWVSPNPQVGCVIVKDGRVIGEGWHTAYGRLHAEREALAACVESPQGATAYVTLEPCCHYGKTPPCTEGLIEAGIACVVMGAPDPNLLVAGKGVQALRQAGIEVVEGVLVDECLAINKEWLHYIQAKRPYVTAKFACTLDGKIGLKLGEQCWLTGPESRNRVHEDRHKAAAVMVGIGTVLADDPQLTCRLEGAVRQPLRVVLDSQLRMPVDCQLAKSASFDAPVLVVGLKNASAGKANALRNAGVEVVLLEGEGSQVDLSQVLSILGSRGVDSLIVEGGPTLHASFFRTGLVNGFQAYVAPKVFGSQALSAIGGLGTLDVEKTPQLKFASVTPLGHDLLIEGEVL